MAGYDELKIQVGFTLDKGFGADIQHQLDALSNAKDFKIKAEIDVKDAQIQSLEKLDKVLERLSKTNQADLSKIKSIGNVFSSLKIDDSVVNNIAKVEKTLMNFSKLSKDLQKKIANVDAFEGMENDVKGVTMKMDEFDRQVQKTLKNIHSGVKGSSESLTGYINSQSGTVKTLVEQLNDVYKVTKNIDGSGNVIGKVSGNVEGYVDKVGSLMKQNYTKLLQYQGDYYKAVANQDKDMVVGLEEVMDFYKYQQKLLSQSLDNNGLKDFAKSRISEIEDIYNLNSKLSDIKGVKLLDKENLKSDEKALTSFISQYDSVVKDLQKYEPKLMDSRYKGDESSYKFLKDKVDALRNQKTAMEEMIPSFKQWDTALKEFEKRDSALSDRIKQKQAELKDKEVKQEKKVQEKDESDKYKNAINNYKKVSDEIKSLMSKQMDAQKSGDDLTYKQVSQELQALERKREGIRQTVESLEDYSKAQKAVSEIDSKFNRDTGIKDSKIKDKTEKEKYARLLSNYKDVSDQLNSLAKKQRTDLDKGNKVAFSETTEQIKALSQRKKAMEEEMRTLREYARAKEEVNQINRKHRDELKTIDAGRKDSSISKADEDVKKLAQSYEKLGKAIQDNLSKATNLKDSSFLKDTNIDKVYNDLLKMSNIKFDNLGKADVDNLLGKVERLGQELKKLENVKLFNRQSEMNNLKVDKLEGEFRSLENQIRRTFGDSHADALVSDLNQLRQAANQSGDEFDVMARRYTNSMDEVRRSMRSMNTDMGRSGGFFRDFYENMFTYTAGELLADGVRAIGRGIKDTVMEYDHAMTNLKKVANPKDVMESFQLDAIKTKAVDIAKSVGSSSQDVIQAIADTVQMSGKSMEESIVIAEQTMMLANVAEMTQESASEAVVSMMAAFNLDPLKEIPVVVNGVTKSTTELTNAMDMVNHVGNNFSISSEGIVSALQKGGAVLAQYGVSMSDTIALTAGANKVLQDPEVVGNGLKSIAINMAGLKVDARSGEIALNKTATALKNIAGIDIFEKGSQTDVKNMAQLMDEVYNVWGKLDDRKRIALSEAIAGKQQARVFQALMAGYEDVKKVQQELNSGAHFGSAFAENAQYVDSLAGKLNALKEVWVGIFQTVFDDSSIKGILDGLIAVSEVIADVVNGLDKVGLAGPTALAGLVGGFSLMKNLAGRGTRSFIGNMVEDMLSLDTATEGVDRGLRRTTQTGGLLGRVWDVAFGTSAVRNTRDTARGVENVARASRLSVRGLAGMAKGFWSSLSVGMKFGLVGTAVIGVAGALDYASKALDRQYSKLTQSTNAHKTEIQQLETKKSSLAQIQEEYDGLYNKSNRTTEETARMLALNKEIAKIMPELVKGYDVEGNPILDMKGDVSDLIAEMEKGIETKKRLLSMEQEQLAKNSIKQMDGGKRPSQGSHMSAYKLSELEKLMGIENKHNIAMGNLYNERDRLETKMLNSSGKKREEYARKLMAHDNKILNAQEKANNEYVTQLNKIQEYSKNIGDSIFSSIESGYTFDSYSKELQGQISGLKSVLDFSDIDTEDKMYAAQNAIKQLGQAASYGLIDLDSLKKSLQNANTEFAKTHDIEAYNSSISALVDQVSSVTGIDKNILTDLFKNLAPSLKEAETSLDGFMSKFGKSTSDLQNKSDKMAQAVKKQYDAIRKASESIQITGNADIDYKTAINLVTDQDLPTQVRDMVRTLLNKGHGPSEVLEVAQKLLVDMSDGEVDIESFQKMIDEQFGEGEFEITPELFVNPEVQEAQIQETVDKVKSTFGEIPTEVETLVKANSLTAEADVNRVMSMYQLCPEEVLTLIETQGSEQAYQTITKLMTEYNNIPIDIKTELRNNGVESVQEIVNLNNIYESLPKEVQTYISANSYEALVGAKNVEDVLKNIPPEVLVDILTKTTGKESAEQLKGVLDKLPPNVRSQVEAIVTNNESVAQLEKNLNSLPISKQVTLSIIKGLAENDVNAVANAVNSLPAEKRMQVIAAIEQALGGINTVDQKKLRDKIAQLKANASDANSKISTVQNKKINDKKFSVNANDKASGILGGIISKLRGINSKTITVTSVFKTVGSIAKGIFGGPKSGGTKRSFAAPPMDDAYASSFEEPISPYTYSFMAAPPPVETAPSPMLMRSVAPTTFSSPMLRDAPMLRDMPSTYGYSDPMLPHKYGLNLFVELDNQLKKIASQLDIIDEKSKKAMGEEKIKYLKQQINLYKQQQTLQKQMISDMQKYQSSLKGFLSNKGFGFDGDGNITNYHTKLVAMEQEYERLEDAAKKASDASSEYKGDNEKEKDRLSQKSKDAQKAADDYKKNLDEIKKAMDSYIDVTFNDIPNAESTWEELNNKIKENLDLIEEFDRNQKLFEHQNKVKELEYEYDKLADRLSIIEIKLKNAYGKDKLDLMNEQIALLEKQKKIQEDLIVSHENMAKVYRDDLSKYGFAFDKNGDITNLDETLNKFKNSSDLQKVKELVEEYMKVQRDQLPDIREEYEKLESEIKNVYKEQLEITKSMEDKLTNIYKEQIQKRKELIDEELDKRLDALDKQKKAYNKAREEEDYEKDYGKQQKVIDDLQAKIDSMSKDTSLSGQKKLQELLDQLKEEQEKLDEMVQDKIDSDTNEKFDAEKEKLEEEAENAKKELDDKFSDEKLQQIVKDALTNGVFVDIDGNIKDLQDTLLKFEDEFGDGMTAMGDVIKSELIANLNVAKDTIKDLNKVLGELDLKKANFGASYSLNRNAPIAPRSVNNTPINFNSPLINVEGNVDNKVIGDLKKIGSDLEKQITENILNSMR